MKVRKPVCLYCHQPFHPSAFHPKQGVCLSPECQRRRRSDYHRIKIATDSDYRQVCADSRGKWRENNPGYQQRYRSTHEEYCEQNRQKQQGRNQKRKLSLIVKNNLAIDVKRLPAKVWMTGPGLDEIVKNNLAISQVLILQTVSGSEAAL
jgi:recombinational DNA repair protein (RecF pathway)